MLAEKFFLVLETLRSHASDDNLEAVITNHFAAREVSWRSLRFSSLIKVLKAKRLMPG
jgi:hypothetical protein